MSRIRYIHMLLLALLLSGCFSDSDQQEAKKWRITFDPQDKRPYGTYIANQSVQYYFPEATFEALPRDFHFNNIDEKLKTNDYGKSLILFAGLDFKVSEDEWTELKDFARNGNEVVIFCSNLDEKIENELSCYKQLNDEEENTFYGMQPDLNNANVLSIADDPFKHYGYQGRSIKGYFTIKNTRTTDNTDKKYNSDDNTNNYIADTLGYANGKPDFVKFRIGNGHITLHAAPLVVTNYFLLQPGNIDYLTAIYQTLPKNINRIYTHNYYKRSGQASGLSVLWQYPATKWALLLGIFALLLYVLFEGKRKQRIIPVIPPLRNDSVSFAETVGRLYYNKGNHANLAAKMSQQFLEWVRIHYFLNTNLLNDHFVHQLSIKSGQPEAVVRGLMDMIHEIRLGDVNIDDAYLYQLYNTIQYFYKNHRI